MHRDTKIDPDELDRPDWNSLKANYSKHDVGEAYFVGRMDQIGLHTEHWGIDMRDDDGDGLIFDNKMDLRLWEPLDGQEPPATWPGDVPNDLVPHTVEEWHRTVTDSGAEYGHDGGDESWDLRGIVDVKTKASESWLGVLNLRHLAHYAEWSRAFDVPVFLYFTMVDMDAEAVGERNILVPVEEFDYLDAYVDHFDHDTDFHYDWSQITEDCEYVSRSFRAPDGNPVVQIDEDYYRDFDYLVEEIL